MGHRGRGAQVPVQRRRGDLGILVLLPDPRCARVHVCWGHDLRHERARVLRERVIAQPPQQRRHDGVLPQHGMDHVRRHPRLVRQVQQHPRVLRGGREDGGERPQLLLPGQCRAVRLNLAHVAVAHPRTPCQVMARQARLPPPVPHIVADRAHSHPPLCASSALAQQRPTPGS